MRRDPQLDFRRSLRRMMDKASVDDIYAIAVRQLRTVDALLQRLYDNQAMQRRELALLADEVGLGKTFVALGVAWSVWQERRRQGLPQRPILILTPSSHALYTKWKQDAETFFKQVLGLEPEHLVGHAEKTHELVQALSSSGHVLVIARMSAVDGKLSGYAEAMAAGLHFLFKEADTRIDLDARTRLLQAIGPLVTVNGRDNLDLRRTAHFMRAAQEHPALRIGQRHFLLAWRRLQRRKSLVVRQLEESLERVRQGGQAAGYAQAALRELVRATLGQRVRGDLPLVIVDEIHNWKNHPQSWQRFLNLLGGRVERMLGLSATPFQLGHDELIRLLDLRTCLHLEPERHLALDAHVDQLAVALHRARQSGEAMSKAWCLVEAADVADIELHWAERRQGVAPGLPSRIHSALQAAHQLEQDNSNLMAQLRPFLVRHLRQTQHRRWWVGRDAQSSRWNGQQGARQLAWRPGLDVRGDGELVHYLMMRATQLARHERGAASLGADLGGSYDFFREHELHRLKQQGEAAAMPYLALVEQATGPQASLSHPKVGLTVERAFTAWLDGEKTLIFGLNPLTVDALRNGIAQRIHAHERQVLSVAFGCDPADYYKRLANFQKRLYNNQQSLFLLFQDHPLVGAAGRVPAALALTSRDLRDIARKLAAAGPPREHSRFDRRRVLAATEQVLVARWQQSQRGRDWLEKLFPSPESDREGWLAAILAPDWPQQRRIRVEGVLREADAEAEPFPDEDDADTDQATPAQAFEQAWREILDSQAGRDVLAPYLADGSDIPSLLTRWHAPSLQKLTPSLRALAVRMFRRLVRSPGFLARFLLNDITSGQAQDDESDTHDGHWQQRLHDRWNLAPPGGESARDRFNAYLDTLCKVIGRAEGQKAYEQAARNRDTVARMTGAVPAHERTRYFTGFNTPLVPEVLILTSVGQEGIDLHRECRHVIHHDLPWNPATLEQRTGRIDRIGSKAERLRRPGGEGGELDVVLPYVANTYDEYRFRRVHARAQLFDVTMGGDYAIDDEETAAMRAKFPQLDDDGPSVPLPACIAHALRMRLEAEGNTSNQEEPTP